MRELMIHTKEWEYEITGLANRPIDIKPEKINRKQLKANNCILCFITVEKKDKVKEVSLNLSKEIKKTYRELHAKQIVIMPFAHLSNNLATSKKSIEFFNLLEKELNRFNCIRGHFGSDKAFRLEAFGDKGNVRYREY